MAIPVFDVVPIIQRRDGIRIGIVTVAGVSTKHDSADTDNGRIYADTVNAGGGSWRLDLYSDFARSPGSLIARGTAPAVGQYFALAEQNASGVTGRARLEGSGTATYPAILLPTFAVDADVYRSPADAAAMPGYDPDYGLASFHAAAMRQILTSDLPSVAPDLYRGSTLSAFVPLDVAAELPDLQKVQSSESLRNAQADLVKALSTQESEHLDEWADVAAAARERYALALRTFGAANAPKAQDTKAAATGIRFGYFTRV